MTVEVVDHGQVLVKGPSLSVVATGVGWEAQVSTCWAGKGVYVSRSG